MDQAPSLDEEMDMREVESNEEKPLDVTATESHRVEQCCWVWDKQSMSNSMSLSDNDEEVLFHPDYSCGTAAIRGTEPFEFGSQHYWEIKMTSAVYGTDMMMGIGSNTVNLNNCRTAFASLLGKDSESWGLSYLGTIQHKGEMKQFTSKLERNCVIGMHLDLWHGTLNIYNDGKPCGIAFCGLQNKILYPMLSSTAARTRMKLERSVCTPTTLQYLCCEVIGKHVPGLHGVEKLPLPPGMKRYLLNHMGWLIKIKSSHNVGL